MWKKRCHTFKKNKGEILSEICISFRTWDIYIISYISLFNKYKLSTYYVLGDITVCK